MYTVWMFLLYNINQLPVEKLQFDILVLFHLVENKNSDRRK